jgi:hypothetical protein
MSSLTHKGLTFEEILIEFGPAEDNGSGKIWEETVQLERILIGVCIQF